MSIIPFQNDSQLSSNSNTSSRNSDDVEDKFWAALNFAIDDILPCTAFDPKAARAHLRRNASPSPPRIDLEGYYLRYLPVRSKCEDGNSQKHVGQIRPTQPFEKKNINSLRVKVPPTKIGVAVRSTPTTAIPISTLSPFASKAQWNLPTPGAAQPSTPILDNLVSNFLDSLVRESQSRSATPVAAATAESDRASMIVESEVLIQVVEDIDQNDLDSPVEENALTRFSRSFELSGDDDFMTLQIPPSPISVPAKAGFEVPSAFVANGPASCAQELDALWRMRWDRLFAREMYY